MTSRALSIYYSETEFGCTLTAARSAKQAHNEVADDIGKNRLHLTRLATKQDIGWVRAMGGRVPEVK